jgi:hypothetical protein
MVGMRTKGALPIIRNSGITAIMLRSAMPRHPSG